MPLFVVLLEGLTVVLVAAVAAAAAAASRMTEYIIDPAKGTAQLRRVSSQQQ
jgi:hypothetical protein